MRRTFGYGDVVISEDDAARAWNEPHAPGGIAGYGAAHKAEGGPRLRALGRRDDALRPLGDRA